MIYFDSVKMYYPSRGLFKRQTSSSLDIPSLKIEKGVSTAILGPNGAGKTSLLKLIATLLYPTEGVVYVNGYNTVKEEKDVKNYLSFVVNEERSFFWRLTGYQNLEFFAVLDGFSKKSLKERIFYYLNKVGLFEQSNKPVSTYSSGMKQRLSIARGLLRKANLLILDEPTRTLDPGGREQIYELIYSEYCEDPQKSLLIASHHFPEIDRLCTKACILVNGQCIASEGIREIKEKYFTLLEKSSCKGKYGNTKAFDISKT